MKRILHLITLCFVLILFVSCMPNNNEKDVRSKLSRKGYNVVVDNSVIPAAIYATTNIKPDYLITGTKSNSSTADVIYAFSFSSEEQATSCVSAIQDWADNKLSGSTVIQNKRWVYFGTEQGIKDFE